VTKSLRTRKKSAAALSVKQEQAQIIKTIGDRMRQARELCNLSQTEAAKRLGYANSSKLSKVERATDTNSLPIWLLLRASKVYEVSIDYLFGVSESFDLSSRMSQERAVSSWLFEAFQQRQTQDMCVLRMLHNRLENMGRVAATIFDQVDRTIDAFVKFRGRNPEFDDMLGGAPLVRRIEALEASVSQLRSLMRQLDFECRRAANVESLQPQLPFEEGE
jgi:transcriptional regulator with XRE-family HTH domain